jgi:hypothetical protein
LPLFQTTTASGVINTPIATTVATASPDPNQYAPLSNTSLDSYSYAKNRKLVYDSDQNVLYSLGEYLVILRTTSSASSTGSTGSGYTPTSVLYYANASSVFSHYPLGSSKPLWW